MATERVLVTTLGDLSRAETGLILPHEHVFVDLRTPDRSDAADVPVDDIVALMAPEVAAAHAQGVTALVDCATGGVGRRADACLAVSLATGMPILVATGNYREPWIPEWVAVADDARLEAWMTGELVEGIEGTGVRAGWIKLSAGDDGMTALERRILAAAVRAAIPTGAIIGSHTVRGRVVEDQLAVLDAQGGSRERFIWIHAQEEPDFAMHRAVAEAGSFIEYDHVGRVPDAEIVALVHRAVAAGLEHRLLLSQDRGWFDPAQPGGGVPLPYTHLVDSLVPALHESGLPRETIRRITHDNPFEAFAR